MHKLTSLPLVLLLGCPSPQVCTAEAVASVMVEVVDGAGLPVEGAEVVYAVDGGEPAACEGFDGQWVCGWEESGTFSVTASAEGFDPATEELTVEAGECHVQTEAITLVLVEVACPAEAVPSIRATVRQADGSAVPEPEVVWAPSFTSVEQIPCDAVDATTFLCGWDEPGPLDVFAYADGFHHRFVEEIDVAEDDCGVVTTEIDVVMEPVEP